MGLLTSWGLWSSMLMWNCLVQVQIQSFQFSVTANTESQLWPITKETMHQDWLKYELWGFRYLVDDSAQEYFELAWVTARIWPELGFYLWQWSSCGETGFQRPGNSWQGVEHELIPPICFSHILFVPDFPPMRTDIYHFLWRVSSVRLFAFVAFMKVSMCWLKSRSDSIVNYGASTCDCNIISCHPLRAGSHLKYLLCWHIKCPDFNEWEKTVMTACFSKSPDMPQ